MANDTQRRTLSVYDKIDERFLRGSVPAVVSYIENLNFPLSMSFTGTQSLETSIQNEPVEQVYKDDGILYDYGDGRVSKGMRGLELLSKLCKGVSNSDLYLFNNVIYSSNPERVAAASDEELSWIVINNLGMFDVVNRASAVATQSVEEYKQICLRVGYAVRSGIYKKDLFAAQLRRQSRNLVAIAARANLINRGTV
ncbi:hypothetical protein [Stenotrophomonas phage RAS14]